MMRTCCLAAVALLGARPALAEAVAGPPAPHPVVIRGGVAAYLVGGLSGPEDGFAFVAVERSVAQALALEVSIGQGFANLHETGTHIGIGARVSLYASDSDRHVLFAGVGGTLALGGAYGSVPFARAEFGYELRIARGFNLVAAVGPAVALKTSRSPPAPQYGFWSVFNEEGPFRAGDTGPSLRLAAGWAF